MRSLFSEYLLTKPTQVRITEMSVVAMDDTQQSSSRTTSSLSSPLPGASQTYITF